MVPQLEHNSFEHRKQPRPKAKEKCCGEKFHRMQLEKKKKKKNPLQKFTNSLGGENYSHEGGQQYYEEQKSAGR